MRTTIHATICGAEFDHSRGIERHARGARARLYACQQKHRALSCRSGSHLPAESTPTCGARPVGGLPSSKSMAMAIAWASKQQPLGILCKQERCEAHFSDLVFGGVPMSTARATSGRRPRQNQSTSQAPALVRPVGSASLRSLSSPRSSVRSGAFPWPMRVRLRPSPRLGNEEELKRRGGPWGSGRWRAQLTRAARPLVAQRPSSE